MTLLKILKSLIFHQSEDDAIEISRAAFGSKIDSLVALESYFKKSIGDTEQCLTGADMVLLVFHNKSHQHLQECHKCHDMYNEMQGKFIGPTLTDLDEQIIDPDLEGPSTPQKSKSKIRHEN